MTSVERLVVHHSASSRVSTTLEWIEGWHRAKGWDGVGYHWVIEDDGVIRAGRPVPSTGAHVRGHNDSSLGVCVVGDNTREEHRWNDAQKDALRRLVAACRVVWPGIPVVRHADVGPTLCPGITKEELRAIVEG